MVIASYFGFLSWSLPVPTINTAAAAVSSRSRPATRGQAHPSPSTSRSPHTPLFAHSQNVAWLHLRLVRGAAGEVRCDEILIRTFRNLEDVDALIATICRFLASLYFLFVLFLRFVTQGTLASCQGQDRRQLSSQQASRPQPSYQTTSTRAPRALNTQTRSTSSSWQHRHGLSNIHCYPLRRLPVARLLAPPP